MTQYISEIFAVLAIHLLAVISPGPDFIVAVKNSLTYSRRIGFYTAIGFGSFSVLFTLLYPLALSAF